jgi:protocadherin Fat 1/2/3
MTAVDNDRNDHVRYSIPSEILSSGLFQLDQDTGEVWSAAAFDREEKDRYDIPVTATDRNGKSGFSVLKVRIIDVNDNAPAFDLVIIIVLNSITSNKLFISIK